MNLLIPQAPDNQATNQPHVNLLLPPAPDDQATNQPYVNLLLPPAPDDQATKQPLVNLLIPQAPGDQATNQQFQPTSQVLQVEDTPIKSQAIRCNCPRENLRVVLALEEVVVVDQEEELQITRTTLNLQSRSSVVSSLLMFLTLQAESQITRNRTTGLR